MSIPDAVDTLDLDSIGVWTLIDDDPEDQLRWNCGTGELIVRPPDEEDGLAEIELAAPVGGKITRGTVFSQYAEWLEVLQFAVSWLRKHDYGTPVEYPDVNRDVGVWEFASGVYVEDEISGTLEPRWAWIWGRDDGDEVLAVVRPEDGRHVFDLIDDSDVQRVGEGFSPVEVAWQAFKLLSDRDDGAGLGRVEVPFGRRDQANEWRDNLPSEALTGRFDGRHKTVEVYRDFVDDAVLEEMELDAMDSRSDEIDAYGQMPLTDHEYDLLRRRQSSFSAQDRFKAQAVKAIATEKGVDDWVSHFDATLNVDEHRELLDDLTPGRREATDAPENVRTGRVDRRRFARKKCLEGEVGACRHLLEHHDVCEDEMKEWAEEHDELAAVIDDVL